MNDSTSAQSISLENHEGVVVRAMAWPDSEVASVTVVRRKDTRRLELMTSTRALGAKRIEFDTLGVVNRDDLAKGPITIDGIGKLRLIRADAKVLRNEVPEFEGKARWRASLGLVLVAAIAFVVMVHNRPADSPKIEQELRQQVVQIVKRIQVKPQQVQSSMAQANVETAQPVKTTTKTASIKRMGALAAFGSAKNSNQRGGINLGAVNTTAGPGLGGTAGSGGVQTSNYATGLVSAPLGAGGNMQGGGGYGTKGKGGGQAGYGKISLVGSAGAAPIPLGREAIVGGGLDKDLISEVIARNMGQVRFCYEQGLQGDPSLGGRVAVDFTIGGNGQVKTAGVGSTTVNSQVVEECILLRLRTWKFPLPDNGADVKVSFPFVLRRTGQG